jgi:hypothetical protein
MIEPERLRPPISTLLRELAEDARGLVRDEVRLAKAETTEKLTETAKSLVPFAVAGVLGLVALLMLATAANAALTTLLAKVMSVGIAVWLSPLTLALVLAIVAWSLVATGKAKLRHQSLKPEKTMATLQEDKQWIKSKLS